MKLLRLQNICLELLEKYKGAQISVIWEYSTNIVDDEKALQKEVEEYQEKIIKAVTENDG